MRLTREAKISTNRESIDAFMRGDDRVDAFDVSEAGGRLEVAAHAAPAWVAEERAEAHARLSSRIIKQWQMVYDRSYRSDQEIHPPNFEGWTSPFTAEPMSLARMRIWLDDALAHMRGVPHARVLEIGCGVGLVVAGLAPGGVAYHGIDVSEEAIASLDAWMATQPALSHVRLARRAAHELDGLDVADAELAVLNSVLQYFPDVDYLLQVLAGAAERLVEGGAIFLGDVRASALLPMHATCVAAARAKSGATVGEVRADAAAVQGLARELVIDPGFLDGLGTALPRLGTVRYSLKPKAADHELSGYRYNAMLCLDRPRDPQVGTWQGAPLADILAQLDAECPEAVAITAIPNARLAHDVALTRALAAAAPSTALADLDRSLATDPVAIEPEALTVAVRARGYEAELRFTPGSAEGRFDALLLRPGTAARWPAPATDAPLVNDPLGDELAAKLRRDLQKSLDAALGGRGIAHVELTP